MSFISLNTLLQWSAMNFFQPSIRIASKYLQTKFKSRSWSDLEFLFFQMYEMHLIYCRYKSFQFYLFIFWNGFMRNFFVVWSMICFFIMVSRMVTFRNLLGLRISRSFFKLQSSINMSHIWRKRIPILARNF